MDATTPAGTGASAPGRGLWTTLLPAQAGPTLALVLLAPVVPGIAAWFGTGGAAAAQQVVTFPFLGLTIGSLICGPAIRAAGLRRLILLAFAAFGVAGAIGLMARELPLLLAGCALMGLAAAFFTSGLSAVTAILYDGAARARMVGLQSAAGNLIGVAMGLSVAVLAERLGWRTPFGAILAFAAVMLVLSAIHLPALPRGGSAGAGAGVGRTIARIWPICLLGAAGFVIATCQSTQLPFLLVDKGLGSAGLRALVTVATPTTAMLGSLTYSAVQGRWSDRRIGLLGGIAGAAGWFLFWRWEGGVAVAMIGAALIGFALGVVMPILFTRTMRAVPPQASGTAIGLLNATVFLGSFANPAISTPLRAAVGLSGAMFWLGVTTLLLTAIAIAWPDASARSD